MKPQPPVDSPVWSELGGDPSEGRIYTCGKPGIAATPTLIYMVGGGIPDPEDLARRALDQMQLATPDIHLAPQPPERTYVGLDTWLWMPAVQWATLRKSVTAGATTVTVTAVPKTAVWDMGPANKTCTSAGREWKFGKMQKGSTTGCSYKYTKVSDFQPDKKFRVTSTISYQVDWTCAGACLGNSGTLGRVNGLPGVAAIVVGERQSVVVGGDD
ncbi:hypothetical protein [Aeromicrobium panaciterrae]|uniref:hypothetical protein n=1 Tax=Aeromicrobium panaciterrae TaxID=363861 RepID=UPI0031D6EF9E